MRMKCLAKGLFNSGRGWKFFLIYIQNSPGSDLPVTDPLLLPLSYFKSIVEGHNGCLCAFSLLPFLNGRPPALLLQYVQCKWQPSEWRWMFEIRRSGVLPEAAPDCEDVRDGGGGGEAADTWHASQSLSSCATSHHLYQRALLASICQQHNTTLNPSLTPPWAHGEWSNWNTQPHSLN